jgi:hypothetical protein
VIDTHIHLKGVLADQHGVQHNAAAPDVCRLAVIALALCSGGRGLAQCTKGYAKSARARPMAKLKREHTQVSVAERLAAAGRRKL